MNQIKRIGTQLVLCVSLLCLALLLCGVVWASGRSFEMTDEAYYLLSAIYPEAVQAYISAQHWTLAPLWQLTGSLVGFRLIGAAVLIGSAGLLALGATRLFLLEMGHAFSLCKALPVIAASGVFALLYVATIQPSPSYNLLASAGAYAAGGAVLLGLSSKQRYAIFYYCALAGVFLAIGFVNKPSAGISSAIVALAWVLFLLPGAQKWICLVVLPLTAGLAVFSMATLQNADPGVLQSLENGLALFRQVQTEPVGARLIRYAVTLFSSIGQTALIFWPALALIVAALFFKRIWLAVVALLGFLTIILIGQHFLGGMSNYRLQLEAIYALMIALALTGMAALPHHFKSPHALRVPLLLLGLIFLPYAVAVGTGNSLFTQVIVSLAPWGVLAGLSTLSFKHEENAAALILRQGASILLLSLITVQILTSYTRDPYHLAAPLTGQNTRAQIGDIGAVRTDPGTAQVIADLEGIKAKCQITSTSPYLGLYNTPGLALLLSTAPPVSPWLNNAKQAEFVLDLWPMETNISPLVLAISKRPDGTPYPLPKRLEDAIVTSVLCGTIVLPYNQQTVDIRTVSKL